MKLIEQFLEELETKARAARAMGERVEMDSEHLLTLIKSARGKKESLDLMKTRDLKPGYYQFSHTLYMIDHDYRFKGPFETLDEAKEELGISQVEIDQAFFRSNLEVPNHSGQHSDKHADVGADPEPTETGEITEFLESVDLIQPQNEFDNEDQIKFTQQEGLPELQEAQEQNHSEDLPEHIR